MRASFSLQELLPHQDRGGVVDLRLSERDGLGDDVVGREQQARKILPLETSERLAHPFMMRVVGRRQREEEARVNEDHL